VLEYIGPIEKLTLDQFFRIEHTVEHTEALEIS
jgi:hypothetical protein